MCRRAGVLLCFVFHCIVLHLAQVPAALARPDERSDAPTPDAVVVGPGDALSTLAKRHGVAVSDLRTWNELTSDRIESGRTLRLGPKSADAREPVREPNPEQRLALSEPYEVKPGDALSVIAQRHGCTVADLVEWNGGLDPDRIFAGQKLRLSDPIPLGEHTVAVGENLTAIARLHHVTLAELKAWNPGLAQNRIRSGQTLKVASRRPQSLSESIGLPYAGRLKNAARLAKHAGWVVRDPQRAFGTDETVRYLETAFDALKEKHPFNFRVEIHDLSFEHGGPISDHASHQSGRDVDIALISTRCSSALACDFRKVSPAQLDARRQWALLYHWLRREQVEAVLVDYSLQAVLYKEAKARGATNEELSRWFQYPRGRAHPGGTIRHYPNHADHLHVRFGCHRSDPECSAVRVIADEARMARAAELAAEGESRLSARK